MTKRKMNGRTTEALRINAEPWEPPPGMFRVQCGNCWYWFASLKSGSMQECPDCIEKAQRELKRVAA